MRSATVVSLERDHSPLYFPIATCLLLSLVFSFALWILNRRARSRLDCARGTHAREFAERAIG